MSFGSSLRVPKYRNGPIGSPGRYLLAVTRSSPFVRPTLFRSRFVNQELSGTSSTVFAFAASTGWAVPNSAKIWPNRSYMSLSSISAGSGVSSVSRSTRSGSSG